MQVFTFFEVEQHFPNVCPCNSFQIVDTDLNLIYMLEVSYASIDFSIISEQFH